MKNNSKTILVTAITYLYIFLFIYAAVSKILDFEAFKIQLGQSPLLSAYASTIAVLIPTIEIVVALIMLLPRIRYIGLLLAFGLMVMFSSYIIIILNYSDFIPCSCGGILSEMNWEQHLFFNFIFVAMGGLGFILDTTEQYTARKQVSYLVVTGILTTILVIILYKCSENEMHRNNAFIRRYPHHPITALKGFPLPYNSYYIAGFHNGKVILGNATAPLHIVEFDTATQKTSIKRIEITTSKKHPFAAIQIKINSPFFYMVDGTIPIIYKGNIENWTTTEEIKPNRHFSLFEPITEDLFLIRQHKTNSNEYDLNILNKDLHYQSIGDKNVLQKNLDGIFDADGMLLYNIKLKKVIYTYYYRNEFITTDKNLNTIEINNTIDTLRQAPLEFAYMKKSQQKKLAKQPTTVNIYAATESKYLFIKSNRLGKYESENIAKQASIIDVYNIDNSTYEFSFYLYHYKNEEIKTFKIYNNLLVGLTSNHLIIGKLKPTYFKLNY
ncbi:MauE/DoxX family redox-associated membrane protein [Flavobacterium ardleyense]|uniref:MauE/DoxX family redox-associated membrane protein n=1 Tax=Flavobacterium ardleyense TaxID=2038737 RepID=A0ABW5Z587_9FLAO